MHFITLNSETDFEGWRKAARALALNNVAPADVTWTVAGNELELFQPPSQIRRVGADRDPASRYQAFCNPIPPAVAAAGQSRTAGCRHRSGHSPSRGNGQGGAAG